MSLDYFNNESDLANEEGEEKSKEQEKEIERLNEELIDIP